MWEKEECFSPSCGYHLAFKGNKFAEGNVYCNATTGKFEASVFPKRDKGYRDPYKSKTFSSLEEAKKFVEDFFVEES